MERRNYHCRSTQKKYAIYRIAQLEEIKVIFRRNVSDYLDELIFVLYENEYFGFKESAKDYVQKIYDFIEYNLPIFPAKQTPEKLSSLGSEYIFYKANQNTTWYIFFERSDNRFMVTFITNSHSDLVKLL